VDFMFADPTTLAARLTGALQILDEVGADLYNYAQIHAATAAMAAIFGNLDLARGEATVALEIARRLGNPSRLALALYAFGLTLWQSDPADAQAALEEHIQIVRATGYTNVLARVLALHAQLLARAGNLPDAIEALRNGLASAHLNGDLPATAVCAARGAFVLAALGEPELAAVLWGAVTEGVLARLGALPPNETSDHDQLVAAVRSQLGDDRYAAATARGSAMTYEQITAFALAAVEDLRLNSQPPSTT
jgi:tetratricopeptide (TPR) repeat protein